MALLPQFCHRHFSRDWWCANAQLHLQNIQAIRHLISIERNMKQMLHTSFVTGFSIIPTSILQKTANGDLPPLTLDSIQYNSLYVC